jgi:ribosomal protein L35
VAAKRLFLVQERRETQRCANKRYRATEKGKQKRAAQAKAYRLRKAINKSSAKELQPGPSPTLTPAGSQTLVDQPSVIQCEGYTQGPKSAFSQKKFCQRFGCTVSWEIDPRTPHKKYCSRLCDNDLHAASVRVERFYKSLGHFGGITSANRTKVLLAKPGSRSQLRAFQSVVLRC